MQLQRDQNKAFIAYEKISKTIDSVLHEEQITDCYKMLGVFWNNHKNYDLHSKLHRELILKIKSLEKSFNS